MAKNLEITYYRGIKVNRRMDSAKSDLFPAVV
jgi:hypothetical protein